MYSFSLDKLDNLSTLKVSLCVTFIRFALAPKMRKLFINTTSKVFVDYHSNNPLILRKANIFLSTSEIISRFELSNHRSSSISELAFKQPT